MTTPVPVVASGFLPIKTLADFRLVFHAFVLAAVPLLVTLFGVGQSSVAGWAAVALAAADAILSFTNTADGIRELIYAIGGVAQTVLLAVGNWNASDVISKVGAVVTFLVALVAVFYTPNSVVTAPLLAAIPPAKAAPRKRASKATPAKKVSGD